MTEKIFVIGSNSFSGASFIDFALREGCELFGISRSPELAAPFLPYRWDAGARSADAFRFQQLDLNHDLEKIVAALNEFRPKYVVNFAAQAMVAESWTHPEHWYTTNVVANVKLHDRMRGMNFIEKYVHISTPEVYGSCSGNVTEEAPFNPSTPYAASRAACDLHLKTFLKNYQFPVVFTRAANVYGPGQQLYRIIPRTILFIKLGRRLKLHGAGHSVRSFIHIRDVADGTLRAARLAAPGETFHFSTPVSVSIRRLVEIICSMTGASFENVVDIVDDRPGKDAAYLLESGKARRELGWEDQVALEEGIQQTIDWVSANLTELKNQPHEYIHKP